MVTSSQERVAVTTAVSTPALYRTVIRHTRHAPFARSFRYRHPMWLVDLAELPTTGLLGKLWRFEARDHVGDPAMSLRDNLVTWVAEHGVDVASDRVVMLANARTLGHVFNPITVYWCLRADNTTHCVVTEVHNTYGGRHCYLLQPDETGSATVDKAMYVSPFNPVDGRYDMRFTVPSDRVHVGIILRRAGKVAFSATLNGRRKPATRLNLLRTLARYPMASLRVAALIRYQGGRLVLRGLPIVKRSTHPTEGQS
jgi:DUF1365 family protein